MKINLAQQNQASTLPDRALFAHLSSETHDVKSGETHVSSFNGASRKATSTKSADPTLYNVSINSKETPMQKFQAAYESMPLAESEARRSGWDGGDYMLDYLNGCHPRAYRTFPSHAMAEAWLKSEIKAGKSLFGCGDIDVLQQPKRRCRHCTCQGWLTVKSFLVDDDGITEEREPSEECWDGED